MTSITDALTIRRIAAAIGCTATIATTGDQLTDDREHPCDFEPRDERADQAAETASYAWLDDEYPTELWIARKAEFIKHIRECDPRTPEQRMRDEFEKEVMDTRRSDYPY